MGDTTPPNAGWGYGLILLEGTVLLTLALVGGTRLSSLANGVTVFGLYGLAFVGGWMEQIGTMAGTQVRSSKRSRPSCSAENQRDAAASPAVGQRPSGSEWRMR